MLNTKQTLKNEMRVLPKKDGCAEQHHYQFLKNGFFVVDEDTTADKLIFNRVVSLKE